MTCPCCYDTRWVCEAHPECAWKGDRAHAAAARLVNPAPCAIGRTPILFPNCLTASSSTPRARTGNSDEEAANKDGLTVDHHAGLLPPGVLGFVLPVDAGADEGIQIADIGFDLSFSTALFLGSADQQVSLNRFPASP
jgi:hypothetical protein